MVRHSAFAPERFPLRDGREVVVRPIRPDDAAALEDMAGRLSARALRLRFFSPTTPARLALLDHGRFFANLANVDFDERAAWVAHFAGETEVRAVGRYQRLPDPSQAEIAFVVEDSLQGNGICTELLHHLAAYARGAGISTLVGIVLAENIEMVEVLRHGGYPVGIVSEGEIDRLTLDIRSGARE